MNYGTKTIVAILALSLTAPAIAQEASSGTPAASMQEDSRYSEARGALEAGRYEQAIDLFQQLIEEGSRRRDAALYWTAYAQERMGARTDALRTIARLRSGFPASSWLDDARYLEAEIRGQQGRPIDPEDAEDEEMRLLALNALMRVDSERALPVLERILRDDSSPEMKERALFILIQGNEDAFDLLAELARDSSDPQLQRQALQHAGLTGGDRALDLLDEAYESTDDREVKEAVLHGYMQAGDTERLMRLAREESDERLRTMAIEALAVHGGGGDLWQLYDAEISKRAKRAILHSMAVSGSTDRLVELVRSESDPDLQRAALEALVVSGDMAEEHEASDQLRPLMLELLRDGERPELQRTALQYFWMREDAAALIELFEQTDDRELKRQIVEALSIMETPEATDFLLRLIEQ